MTVEADGAAGSPSLSGGTSAGSRAAGVPQHRRGTDAGAGLRSRAGRRRRLRRHPGRRRGALAADDHRVPPEGRSRLPWIFRPCWRERRLLAIVRGRRSESALEAVLTLAREGVSLIEVSLTSDKALDVITRAREELGTEAVIGAGTVITAGDARDAHAAGAEFIVTPGLGAGVTRGSRPGPTDDRRSPHPLGGDRGAGGRRQTRSSCSLRRRPAVPSICARCAPRSQTCRSSRSAAWMPNRPAAIWNSVRSPSASAAR